MKKQTDRTVKGVGILQVDQTVTSDSIDRLRT